MGVQPDQDCIGLVVHTRARDWRVKDAIAMIQEAKANGVHVSEHYAFLLRQRCKEMGIMHPDVPEHPVGWQFRPEVMKKRHSHSRVINKMAASLRPQLRGKWK
ncbi:hypothetical protein EON67_09400 [archaeon]|nr:MAG: hypothetical protein EON67_09400 [archaeon]